MWRPFASRLMNASGITAASAGAIFFVAANWKAMGMLGRFGLLEVAFAVCAQVAEWRAPPHPIGRNATAVLVIITGALLATFDQTYQTGAEASELFIAWAGLALPFAIASRSGAIWALWWILLEIGLGLFCGWLSPSHAIHRWRDRWGMGMSAAILVPAGVNFAGAAILLWLGRTRWAAAAPGWLAKVLLGIAFAYGTFGSIEVISEEHDFIIIPVFAAACIAVAIATVHARKDVFPMALIAASVIAFTTAVVGKGMSHGYLGGFLLAVIWLTGTSAAAGFLLMHWVRQWRPDEEGEPTVPAPYARPPARRPWYVSLLLRGAGWLGGVLVLLFPVLLLTLVLQEQSPIWWAVIGAILIGASIFLYLARRGGTVMSQVALGLSIAGQFMVVFGVARVLTRGSDLTGWVALVAFALEAVLAVAIPNSLHRAMSALFACIAWGLFIRFTLPVETIPVAWATTWLPVAGALFAMARSSREVASTAASGLIVALAFATPTSYPAELWSLPWNHMPQGEWLALWPLLSAIAALGALCAAFALGKRGLMRPCIFAALLHFAHFCFVPGPTLLVKSVTMIVLGAMLLSAAQQLERRAAS